MTAQEVAAADMPHAARRAPISRWDGGPWEDRTLVRSAVYVAGEAFARAAADSVIADRSIVVDV